MKQTLQSSDFNSPLVTKGSLIDAGRFCELVHNKDVTRKVEFGFRFHWHEAKKKKLSPLGVILRVKSLGQSKNPMVLEVLSSLGCSIQDVYGREFLKKKRKPSGGFHLQGALLTNQ